MISIRDHRQTRRRLYPQPALDRQLGLPGFPAHSAVGAARIVLGTVVLGSCGAGLTLMLVRSSADFEKGMGVLVIMGLCALAYYEIVRDAVSKKRRCVEVRLNAGHCGACGYTLAGCPREADGCRVCPECGGAWRILA